MENPELSLPGGVVGPVPSGPSGYPSNAAAPYGSGGYATAAYPEHASVGASGLQQPTDATHERFGGENPFGQPARTGSRLRDARRRAGSALAAVGAMVAKFFSAIKGVLLLLPKAKLLLTFGTAMVSVVLYSLVFGWWFAVGFVVLLFVHEMGHVIQLRREGIRATAPVFVPFLGAVVGMRQMPDDALAEARVGLAGPVLGTLGAGACLLVAEATGSTMLKALAYVGFLINLFNLIPLTPLDGGRAMAAMSPVMWFVGLGVMVALFLLTKSPFLLLFAVLGGYDTYRRWNARGNRSPAQHAYYRVSPTARVAVGAVYVALVAVLVAGMSAAAVLHYGAHTFRVI